MKPSSSSTNIVNLSKLTIRQAKMIDNISSDIYTQYNQIIEDIIDDFDLKGIQLLLTISCRNTFTNLLFDPISKVLLLKKIIHQDSHIKIVKVANNQRNIVESLNNIFKVDVAIINSNSTNISVFFGIFLNIAKSAYIAFNDWFWYGLFRLKKTPTKPITYVDTFMYIDSVDNSGIIQDRNYNGFESYLTQAESDSIWLAPTIYGIKFPRQYREICSKIRKTNSNILIQESWLSTFDYLISFLCSIFVPIGVFLSSFKVKSKYSTILRSTLISDIGSPALMLSFYRFLFIRRLSRNNVKIKGAVDWNENQTIDRALSLSFRRYYPGVTIRGYQGFPAKEYNPAYNPTCKEVSLGTVPHEMHVISQTHIDEKSIACKKLKIFSSGAFRYSYLYGFIDKRLADDVHILFALPLVKEECDILVDHAIKLKNSMGGHITVQLKYHPAYDIESTVSKKLLKAKIEITSKPSISLLERASLLVTSESGIAVEAVSLGIPVAIHGSVSGITLNPLLNVKHNTISIKYYDLEELITFSNKCVDYNFRNKCVNNLFFSINRQNTSKLFTF